MPAPASSSANAAQSHTRQRFLPPLGGGATTDRRSIWLAVQQGQKEASSGSTAPHLIQYFSFFTVTSQSVPQLQHIAEPLVGIHHGTAADDPPRMALRQPA